jgi:hypothetical protein
MATITSILKDSARVIGRLALTVLCDARAPESRLKAQEQSSDC